MFEVSKRCGLARIGKWHLEEQNHKVTTPNMLFISEKGIKAPEEAEILLSDKEIQTGKPYIISTDSLFINKEHKISDYTVSPSLVYPPSQAELNAAASKINKDNLSSKIFVVAGKDEAVCDAVAGVEAEVFILANALHLINRPASFVKTVIGLRYSVGHQSLIYTPGLASPHNMALLVYLGIDLVDSVSLILNARKGNYLTSSGKIHKDEKEENFCFCPACLQQENDYDSILTHNHYAALSELVLIKNAIRKGQLRELVELRVNIEPWMVSVLRILDRDYYRTQERFLAVSGGRMIAASSESLNRPEVVRFRESVKNRYKTPPQKKVLLLLPCSAKKPYSFSKSHKAFSRALSDIKNKHVIHEVVITSPLGVVPKELELCYPAQHYDIPVTRTWSKDEISMIGEGISEFLKVNKYETMVVHLPDDYMFISDFIGDFIHTCKDSPTSRQSLDKLREVLLEAVKPHDIMKSHNWQRERIAGIAQFQFGSAGAVLLDNAKIMGRYPNQRIFKEGKQVGMLVGKRGLISLTLEGGKILAGENAYWVKIDDFEPKGNIFAVGVLEAHDDIRIGDDVVVLRNNEPIGVGVAAMNPDEMVQSNRGQAVSIRHLARANGEGK